MDDKIFIKQPPGVANDNQSTNFSYRELIWYLLCSDSIDQICWELRNSENTGDPNNRKSTSVTVIQYGGCPVAWKSQLQKCLILSTKEAKSYWDVATAEIQR